MKNIFLGTFMALTALNGAHAVDEEDLCPSKEAFPKIVKQHEAHLKDKDYTFTFTAKNGADTKTDTWTASSVQFSARNPKRLSFDDILSLKLNYNTSPKDQRWCLAQFHDGSYNSLTIHLLKE